MKNTIPEMEVEHYESIDIVTNANIFLKMAKDKFNLTNKQIADILGISMGTILRWRRDKRGDLKYIKLLRDYIINRSKETKQDILLREATLLELYRHCESVGWNKIIAAGKGIDCDGDDTDK
ncbi:MAG: helix-turn-helix domain-containing protein [Nitrospirae bacterium]|nr:helix-turn-helix domain-containing protein [Nitrospirota bacterium]